MRKRKSKSSFCQVDHLELRQLLSATIYVSAAATGSTHDGASWATAFTDLQSGLTAAAGEASSSNPVIIEVGRGTYNPTSTTGPRTATFQLIDDVSIQGGYAGAGQANPDAHNVTEYPTILSGDIGTPGVDTDNSYHVVTASGTDNTAVLDGFTVTDGNASANSGSNANGGGIFDNAGSPTLSDCTITGNTANTVVGAGGGIYNKDSSSPALTDCTLSENTAEDGGGMGNFDSSPMLTNCTITENTVEGSTAGQGGGGVYNRDSSPTLLNCTISGNTSGWAGGGIYNIAISSPTLINTTITGNAARWGGGINNYSSSSPTLTNCTLSGNTATHGGGGMSNYGFSSPELINCTLTGNSAGTPGGGIYNNQSSSATLTNCILWGDTVSGTSNEIASGSSGTNSVNATYSDIDQSGYAGSNIDSDPLFISGSNLRLEAGSPAIGAGNVNAGGLTGVLTDIDGLSRIVNGSVDMGAYQSHYEFQSTIYVDASATGGNTGSDWTDAYPSLAAALDYAVSGETIDVAQGTYYPSSDGNRFDSFQLVNGVSLEGGFAGQADPNAAQNPATYPTILSGDIGTPGVNTDNSYHVVTGSGTNSTAVLDGFTITAGNASAASGADANGGGIYDNNGDPTLNDCTITNSTAGFGGGGLYAIYKAPTLNNCTISGNTAGTSGGGMYIRAASIDLVNCTITGNSSPGNGGGFANINSSLNVTDSILVGNTANNGAGMFNLSSSPALTNCTLSGNTASKDGGAIYNNSASSPTLTNCILYGDTATSSGNEIYNAIGGSATITYSDVAGGANGIDGNINANPNFIRTVRADGTGDTGNLRLQSDSPAIDAGSDSALSAATDLDGLSRIAGNHVDMGAYESHYPLQSTLYVDASATGAATGSDWADAYPNLAAALDYAVSGETIDVAQGTYYPSSDGNRFDSFQLVNGVSLEGGFAGQADPNAAQNPATYPTILSGDIGTPGVIGDNSYHVVTGSGTDSTAVLDGFTITGGNADGAGLPTREGGGIYDDGGNPTISDCTISGNSANNGGGGIFNHRSSPTLVNCVISGNTATNGDGGAIFNSTDCSPSLINCTISGNTANVNGGGMFNNSNASPTLVNCIFWGNTAPTNNAIGTGATGTNTVSATYSDVEGGYTGTGNIDSDPHFIRNVGTNGPTDYGDLELQGASLAINAGSNAAVPMGVTTDLAGNPRISDGTVDLGAYETQAHLAITTQPTGSVTAGSVFSMAIQVEDPNGDVITNDNSNFTVGLGASPVGAALGGTLNATAVDGVAGFSGLSLTEAGTYSLASSNGNLPVTTSNNFTITAAAPAALVITQQPGDSTAGQDIPAVQVEVEDQYGNLADGTSVNVALSGSTGASLGGTTELATSGGVASFSDLVLTQAGTYTLSITDGDLPGLTSSSFTIDPAAAAKLAFTLEPANATAGKTMANFAVEVQDQYGNFITSDTSTVAIASTPAGISTSIAAVDGIAIFVGVTPDTAGTYTLSASDGSLAGATSSSFTITPGAAATLVITQQPASTLAGQNIPIQVEVEDQYGNPVDGTSVNVAISGSTGASLGGTTVLATSGGVANFSDLAITQAGAYTLSITDGDLPGLTSSSFTINSVAAAKLAFTLEPANATAGQTMANFAIEVQDQYGNLVTSNTSTVAIASTPAGVATSVAAVDGIAIFTGLSTDTAGTYTLSASDGSLAGATSSSFTITPGAAATLVITQQPASTLAGQNIPIQIEVEDQYGNAVDGSSVTLALAGSAPSGAILAGTLTEPTAGGIAAFSDLSLNRAGSDYTLSASDGSLPAVTTQSFAITYAGPQLVFASEPASAVAGGKLPAFTIDTDDTAGNIVTGGKSKITLTLSSGGKIYGSAKATVNKKTGMATFKNISLHTAGTYTLTAADSPYASGISTEFTISAGAAKKLIFDPQPQNAAAASPFNVSVELVNQYGNAVNDGSTVDLVLGAHPKTAVSLNSSAAVSDGFADFDDVTLDTAGPYTLTASDGKLKATSKKFEVA